MFFSRTLFCAFSPFFCFLRSELQRLLGLLDPASLVDRVVELAHSREWRLAPARSTPPPGAAGSRDGVLSFLRVLLIKRLVMRILAGEQALGLPLDLLLVSQCGHVQLDRRTLGLEPLRFLDLALRRAQARTGRLAFGSLRLGRVARTGGYFLGRIRRSTHIPPLLAPPLLPASPPASLLFLPWDSAVVRETKTPEGKPQYENHVRIRITRYLLVTFRIYS